MGYCSKMSSGFLVPASWSWKNDAAGFFDNQVVAFAVSGALYYPVIFGIRAFMRNREAFDLRMPLACWEAGLALFSLIGAMHVVPMLVEDGITKQSICATGQPADPRSFWVFLFICSKIVEFGDTIFIVL